MSAKIAVARLRAGLTDVLSTGIVTRWISGEREAGGDGAEAGGRSRAVVVDSTTNTSSAVKTTSTTIDRAEPVAVGDSWAHPLAAKLPRS